MSRFNGDARGFQALRPGVGVGHREGEVAEPRRLRRARRRHGEREGRDVGVPDPQVACPEWRASRKLSATTARPSPSTWNRRKRGRPTR